MNWQILNDSKIASNNKLEKVVLENRGIKTKEERNEYFNPIDPIKIGLKDLGIKSKEIKLVLERLKTAKEKAQKIVIFGDYDADGVCATSILWQALYKLKYDVLPYIPDRFEEGYGIKSNSLEKIRQKGLDPKLIITVDNGIVAYDAIDQAQKEGIDVIVVDHHQKGEKNLKTDYVLHSTLVCGSALAWFLAKELGETDNLEFVAIGTIADQIPLLAVNRSLVKFGLEKIAKTNKTGLKELIKLTNLTSIGSYEIGYIIAPRINAMGRLSNALDSLRLLCTKDSKKAFELSKTIDQTNRDRQKIVEQVMFNTLGSINEDRVIVISGSYHEGVIGLASGKITERFYRPSIVLSEDKEVSKASARSIAGFNIIEAIRETNLIIEGGGHPMAAGFSIATKNIAEFRKKINEIAKDILTEEVLEKKLKIDALIDFRLVNQELIDFLKKLEPTGQGNYSPVFASKKVKIVDIKKVGSDGKHLKLKLLQDNLTFDAIAFGFGTETELKKDQTVDIAYTVEENVWNNKTTIQLKVKDIKNKN